MISSPRAAAPTCSPTAGAIRRSRSTTWPRAAPRSSSCRTSRSASGARTCATSTRTRPCPPCATGASIWWTANPSAGTAPGSPRPSLSCRIYWPACDWPRQGGPGYAKIARRAARAAPATTGTRHAIFRGSGSSLFGIHVINALLILATLGVYFFWAKVRVRNYLWSESEFEGDRFAYHGTGRELIIGFAKAVAFFFLPITLLNTAPELLKASPIVVVAARMTVSILAAVFIPIAIVGARRYRLSRTSWRGIRFSLRASTRQFVGIWIRGWMLTSLTFGLYYPSFVTSQQRFLTSNTWFGSQRFAFDGRGRDLMGVWLGTIVLFLPTLGLSWFWFAAKRQRYYA